MRCIELTLALTRWTAPGVVRSNPSISHQVALQQVQISDAGEWRQILHLFHSVPPIKTGAEGRNGFI